MKINANNPGEYISQLPDERQEAFKKLRQTILDHLPEGFEERMSYGMVGYVVPHERYPAGYHCDPKLPLPFINIASQKNFIALYHMGIYANPDLMEWFTTAYPLHCKTRLDMGKSCIRFKKVNDIPFELIGQLVSKVTIDEWIQCYETRLR
jgi:uncharacterized protein YdhG (YjbR/CyaY superfamily)